MRSPILFPFAASSEFLNGDESDTWQQWYRLTPLERWAESMKLWDFYLQVGGSLDAEPDSQSPFDAFLPRCPAPADGRSGVRVLRRGGV